MATTTTFTPRDNKELFFLVHGYKIVANIHGFKALLGSNQGGEIEAVCFYGNQSSPEVTTFHTEAQAREYVDHVTSRKLAVMRYKEENKPSNADINVGAFLYSVDSDYLKTDVKIYEVLGKIGKTMILIQEVQKNTVKNDLKGIAEITPKGGDYIGEPLRKKILSGNIGVSISASRIALFENYV